MGIKGNRRIKSAIGWVLSAAVLAVNFLPQVQEIRSLPDTISLVQGQERRYNMLFPYQVYSDGESAQVLSDESETLEGVAQNTLTIKAENSGDSTITLSLLGLIPVKKINVSVYEDRVLVPGGMAVGITLRTNGVLVVGLSEVETKENNDVSPAAQGGLRPGDIIKNVNGKSVNTTKELLEAVERAEGDIALSILRGQKAESLTVSPVKDDLGAKKLGAWVRDSTAGVGTVTYYDPISDEVGALGHPITDPDTGSLLSVREGSMYRADIENVIRGEKGEPGQLCGSFSQSDEIVANLSDNTICGVFGSGENVDSLYPKGLPIAIKSEVQVGKAKIISTIKDDTMEEYDCEIIQLYKYNETGTKSMLLKITDPKLLAVTGGIVQGMSGSPIIQNGKLVGAVTHVLVNDPTKGYGIFIENMLDAAA